MTVEELVLVSMQEERNSAALYTHLQSVSTHPRGKALLEWIARMEKGHLALLSSLFKKQIELPDMVETERAAKAPIAPDADELTILIHAMRKERESAGIYQRGAGKVKDKKMRAIFENLARDEESHFDILKGIYVQLTRREPEL